MECKFTVGQKVALARRPKIKDSRPHNRNVVKLSYKKTYTIRDIIICPVTHDVGVRLVEVTNPLHPTLRVELGYYADIFEPIHTTKTDISIFREIVDREMQKDLIPMGVIG